jgi:hypothetical protein
MTNILTIFFRNIFISLQPSQSKDKASILVKEIFFLLSPSMAPNFDAKKSTSFLLSIHALQNRTQI